MKRQVITSLVMLLMLIPFLGVGSTADVIYSVEQDIELVYSLDQDGFIPMNLFEAATIGLDPVSINKPFYNSPQPFETNRKVEHGYWSNGQIYKRARDGL